MTGFTVVPYGNVIYARPDYVENPLIASTEPDGSLAKPYAALAPEANPATAPANPTNDPNGGLNATSNFFNFNSAYDFNGDGHFDRSALYAAQELSAKGPVVVVALPGIPHATRSPAPSRRRPSSPSRPTAPSGTVNDGSMSVPFDTMLVFSAGSTLKLQDASIYVQNQGSALQALGGAEPEPGGQLHVAEQQRGRRRRHRVVGHRGGRRLGRHHDAQLQRRGRRHPRPRHRLPGRRRPEGAGDHGRHLGRAGRDVDPELHQHQLRRRRTPRVPQGADAITLYNSRPAITNASISNTGGAATGGTSLQAGIAGDLDSFREDDTARGVLVRRVNVSNNSLNGILIRSDSQGVSQQTDALLYPNNPLSLGGVQNYTLSAPLPYILTSLLEVGTELLDDTSGLNPNTGTTGPIPPGTTTSVMSRLYIQPGTMVKFQRGAGIEVVTPGASMNVGDRTYINGFDSLATMQATLPTPARASGSGGPAPRPSTCRARPTARTPPASRPTRPTTRRSSSRRCTTTSPRRRWCRRPTRPTRSPPTTTACRRPRVSPSRRCSSGAASRTTRAPSA